VTKNQIVVVCSDEHTFNTDFNSVLNPYGFSLTFVDDSRTLLNAVKQQMPQLIFVCLSGADADFLNYLTALDWHIPVVILLPENRQHIDRALLRAGVVDFIELPATPETIIGTVHRVLKRGESTLQHQQLVSDLEKANQALKRRLRDFEMLLKVARSIGTLLDGDAVLNRITEAAVFMTGAEEGYLLLVDELSGQLQLRAAQNLGEKQSRNFNIDIHDSIAGQVVQSGRPMMLGGDAGRSFKVKTGLLVKSLLNVPLVVRGRVIGVLGVDNQASAREFSVHHLQQLVHLAGIAATTIDNARQYSETRAKLMRRVREFGLLQALTGQLGIITNFEVGVQMALSMLLKATGAEAGMLHWRQGLQQEPVSITQGVFGNVIDSPFEFADGGTLRWWSESVLQQVLATGKPILHNFPTEEWQEHGSCLATPLKHGKQVVGAVLLRTANEEAFSAEDVYFVTNIADYMAIALEAALLRQRAQADRKRLESLLDVVDSGVWFFDNSLRLVMQNRAASDLVGKSLTEAVGAPIDELLPANNGSPHLVVKLAQQVVRERRPIAFTNSLIYVRGRSEPILATGRVIPDFQNDEPVGVICTVWEAPPMQSNEQLEREFAQMASHLFRTPISIIQSSIDLLLESSLSERERAEILESMHQQGQRLTDTVNELLKILRMETEGVSVQYAPIAMIPIINRAITLVQNDNPYVTFERSIAGTLPLALGDAAKTELIILNLLLNAIRRCAKGGHITVSAHSTPHEVIVGVEDTGKPLTEQEKQRIFQRFYPVNDTNEKLPSTYSFGLYSVKQLVSLQRGRIGVDSTPGATTKFYFSLPVWEGTHDKNIGD